jgi:DNA-binding GntR family transcriptional regulator
MMVLPPSAAYELRLQKMILQPLILTENPAASLTSKIYESLRQDILRGTLSPGKKLRIDELKETYGIGASAIREALSMLTSDLLVQRIDHRGFRVAPVSRSGFDELLKTRCWLEERALRESVMVGDVAWEEAVVLANFHLARAKRNKSADRFLADDAWEMHHKALHKTIISACKSELLLHFCDQMYDLNIRYRRVAGSPIDNARDVENEHAAIVQAALARDEKRAASLLLAHYNRTADLVRNALD